MWRGVNFHPVHEDASVSELARCDMVRYPTWTDIPKVRVYQKATRALRAMGVRPLIVLDGRTLGDDWEKTIRLLLRRYPGVVYWQAANEPDQVGESSWTMTPRECLDLIELAASILHPAGKLIVGPGLVSGNVDYAWAIRSAPVDVWAIHFYGATPDRVNPRWKGQWFGDVGDGIDAYRAVWGAAPIMITEFGIERSGFGSDVEWQAYYDAMFLEMEQSGVQGAMLYCYSVEQCGELGTKGLVDI